MIGILGGTFDPIHLGHLLIAEGVRDALQLERVLFVPAGDPPHKRRQKKTAACHRRQMVERAIANHPQFELCAVDLERPGPHYSVDTVALIRRQTGLSADECYFIIGSDSLADLPLWHNPAKLARCCRLAVVYRPGARPDSVEQEAAIPGLAGRLTWIETPPLDLSASQIRASVRTGRSIRYQVPDSVRQYIACHGLYGQVNSTNSIPDDR